MIRVFIGYDPREAVGFHVFLESILRLTIEPLAITPLWGTPRDGTNSFCYDRFLVPALCEFEGMAIFVDGVDMLMRDSIGRLIDRYDPRYAVQVVQHHYHTTNPRKYLYTAMEAENRDYPCKNWSSVILWNCGHPSNRVLSSSFVADMPGSYLHRFGWLEPHEVGSLPAEWNVLVGEEVVEAPKLLHYTLGIPGIAFYQFCEYAEEWRQMREHVMTCP